MSEPSSGSRTARPSKSQRAALNSQDCSGVPGPPALPAGIRQASREPSLAPSRQAQLALQRQSRLLRFAQNLQ